MLVKNLVVAIFISTNTDGPTTGMPADAERPTCMQFRTEKICVQCAIDEIRLLLFLISEKVNDKIPVFFLSKHFSTSHALIS